MSYTPRDCGLRDSRRALSPPLATSDIALEATADWRRRSPLTSLSAWSLGIPRDPHASHGMLLLSAGSPPQRVALSTLARFEGESTHCAAMLASCALAALAAFSLASFLVPM